MRLPVRSLPWALFNPWKRSCLAQFTGPWPYLPALSQIGVNDLLIPLGLDFESYGTARMMARDAKEARSIVGKVDAPDGVTNGLVLVERLPLKLSTSLMLRVFRYVESTSLPFRRILRS